VPEVYGKFNQKERRRIMEYPQEVKDKLAILDKYKPTKNLDQFDILHLYPMGLAFPTGYYDSRYFNLIGFNTQTMQKRDLGEHDCVDFSNCQIEIAQVFADGAFLLKMKHLIKITMHSQRIYFENVN